MFRTILKIGDFDLYLQSQIGLETVELFGDLASNLCIDHLNVSQYFKNQIGLQTCNMFVLNF